MPNRYVRESAIESERVDKLTWAGEVFYRRLINRVDDFGRFTANPELLRASLFPLRVNKVSAADIGKWLSECETADLVSTWKGNDGKHYLVMHRWEGGRAKSSKYPEPPGAILKRMHERVYTCEQAQTDSPDSDPDPDNDSDPVSDPPLPPKGRKRNPKTLIPADWKPTPETLAWCAEHRLPEPDFQVLPFVTYWQGRGEARADWQATFRNWMTSPYRKDRPHGQQHESAAERNGRRFREELGKIAAGIGAAGADEVLPELPQANA
jgi:hypothetical protein